ncbi:E3 ubiquitin-protein ligase RSL1-like [Lycium barbarum]|uniref:E3 ubiquitin-protein ligase RSL1-like n=1 Tax=Lycium barbarum TaxID=112863 RepID=UPI00293F378C|nr:E3 ubiquitin-protein ligase RSL1-like [Lycium barbarum]
MALDSVDKFYFSALFDDEQLFPISDEKYAEELHMQEALMSAAAISVFNKYTRIKKEFEEFSGTFCVICKDNKPANEMFVTNNCSHSFCVACINKYVTTKIVQENVSVIKCPDISCKAVIKPKLCREIVPKEVFDKWENTLPETLLLGNSLKLYCPYKDCSAMLVVDGSDAVIDTECPNCRRLFCAQCNVSWHDGLECKEFQRLGRNEKGKEDVMLMGIAKNKKWRRCPKCKVYVEKRDGCLHLTCL